MKRRFFAIAAVLALAATTFAHPAQAIEFITVTSTADSGPGTLRQAIIDANNDGDATMIDFDGAVFPGTILLQTRLPRILGEPNTTIDGTGLGVTIDGSDLNGSSNQGLRIRASGTVIKGLTLVDFPGDTIRIQPQGSNQTVTGVLIEDNTFNTKRDALPGDGSDAISVRGGAQNNIVGVTISGNTIMRSTDDGISVRGSFSAFGDGNDNVSVVIDENTINHSEGANNLGLSGDGIRVVSGCGDSDIPNSVTAVISSNTISNSADQGILVKGSGCGNGESSNNQIHADIYFNTVRKSGQARDLAGNVLPGTGITVSGGDRAGVTGGSDNVVTFTISNNIVSKSTNHGISVIGGGGSVIPTGGSHDVSGTVSGNTVSSNARRGILITGGRTDENEVRVTVSNNAVRTSGEEGIRISGGSGDNNIVENTSVQGNTTTRNELEGIGASDGSGSGNTVSFSGISNNIVKGNKRDGIRIRSGIPGDGATPISGNTASRNKQDGIDINSGGYILSNNRADRNTDDGINAGVSINIDGGGNTAKGNADCNSPTFCF